VLNVERRKGGVGREVEGAAVLGDEVKVFGEAVVLGAGLAITGCSFDCCGCNVFLKNKGICFDCCALCLSTCSKVGMVIGDLLEGSDI
jgi:hypothetical protein